MFVPGCKLRSHARNGNECQTPCHRHSTANIEIPGFLNSSKSKARLKFMKLSMLSWSGINIRGQFFVPFVAGLGICLSQTRASHNKPDGFGRERFTFLDETISIASSRFQFFPSVKLNNRSVVSIFGIFRGSFGHFYALIEFSMHLCG